MRADFRSLLQELAREDLSLSQKLALLRQTRELSADATERLDTGAAVGTN
jgi:hypothetical protein